MPKEPIYTDTFVSGEVLPAADLNRVQLETQAEIEERDDELSNDGVVEVGALLPSIDVTDVDLAAGSAYCFGCAYNGPVTIPFAEEDSSISPYYGYIKSSTQTFTISTAKPTLADGLLLFSVMWDGLTLTDLIDLRVSAHKYKSTVVEKTAAYTIVGTDDLILVNATSGAKTISLPPAVDFAGRTFAVIKTDSTANAVVIDGYESETINGEVTLSLSAQYSSANVSSNGTEWFAEGGLSTGVAHHADTHAIGGDDLLSPADIGAASTTELTTHTDATTVHTAATNLVKTTGDQNIAGTKTFTAAYPIGPGSTPTAGDELVDKEYVDTMAVGLEIKAACRIATTAAITLSGEQTIDAVSVVTGDRVLVKNQASAIENGIYVCAAGAWARASDYNTSAEVQEGTFANILEGTANANKQFVQITKDPVLETSDLVFTQLSAAPSYTASLGVQKVGNDFRADLAAAGGITLDGNDLKVNVDASSIEVSGNIVQVKAVGITNAMLAGSIADSKLSQITTASKVSGTALTSLSALPAGAGVAPVANLGSGSPDATKYLRGDGSWQVPAIAGAGVVEINYTKELTANITPATANTSGEITLYTYSVPSNTLGTNKALRVTVAGTYLNSTGGNRTLTVRFKYGGSTFAGRGSGNIGTNAATGNFLFTAILAATGATNSQHGYMNCSIESGANASVDWTDRMNCAVDSTSAQNLVVTVEHSAGATYPTLVSKILHVELLNASDTLGAPVDAAYWTSTASVGLTAEVNMGALSTGLVKITVAGGVATPSTAVAGTDFQAPGSYITALTSDVTAAGPGSVAATIATNAVSLAKMQQIATDKILGRATAETGNVELLDCTAAGRALLDDANAAAQLATLGAQPAGNYYTVGGTDVALADGGTGASLTASNGGILYSGSAAFAVLAGTATASQVLLSGASTTPAWSTATYPGTTTINQLLYSSAANVIGGLTTGNSGVLVTSAGGVPSIGTDIPTAVTIGTTYIYRAGGTDVPLTDGGTGASTAAAGATNLGVGALSDVGHLSIETPTGGFAPYQNMLTYSNSLATTAAWTAYNGSVAADNVVGPDGATTADTITVTGAGNGLLRQTVTLANSTVHTVTLWAKLTSGSGVFNVDLGDGTGVGGTATSTWQKFTLTITSGVSDYLDLNIPGVSAVIAFWGIQLSLGTGKNQYIETLLTAYGTQGFGATFRNIAQGQTWSPEWYMFGDLTTSTVVKMWIIPFDCVPVKCYVNAGITGGVGNNTFDIYYDADAGAEGGGASIFSALPTLGVGAYTTTSTSFSTTFFGKAGLFTLRTSAGGDPCADTAFLLVCKQIGPIG